MIPESQDEAKVSARYPRIPDHSDLRGFSYKAPSNYDWNDDHGKSPRYSARNGSFLAAGSEGSSRGLWHSVKNFLGKGPKGYRRSDERIKDDVCEALTRHPGIDASEIEVEVKTGVVTLKGYVPDRWMKRSAEWLIDRIYGVEDVENGIHLNEHTQNPRDRQFPN